MEPKQTERRSVLRKRSPSQAIVAERSGVQVKQSMIYFFQSRSYILYNKLSSIMFLTETSPIDLTFHVGIVLKYVNIVDFQRLVERQITPCSRFIIPMCECLGNVVTFMFACID